MHFPSCSATLQSGSFPVFAALLYRVPSCPSDTMFASIVTFVWWPMTAIRFFPFFSSKKREKEDKTKHKH